VKINPYNSIVANHKIVRLVKRSILLDIIREKRPISRITISRLTRLNKSTITRIIAGLISEGLVYEGNQEQTPVGRKPVILKLN